MNKHTERANHETIPAGTFYRIVSCFEQGVSCKPFTVIGRNHNWYTIQYENGEQDKTNGFDGRRTAKEAALSYCELAGINYGLFGWRPDCAKERAYWFRILRDGFRMLESVENDSDISVEQYA